MYCVFDTETIWTKVFCVKKNKNLDCWTLTFEFFFFFLLHRHFQTSQHALEIEREINMARMRLETAATTRLEAEEQYFTQSFDSCDLFLCP